MRVSPRALLSGNKIKSAERLRGLGLGEGKRLGVAGVGSKVQSWLCGVVVGGSEGEEWARGPGVISRNCRDCEGLGGKESINRFCKG